MPSHMKCMSSLTVVAAYEDDGLPGDNGGGGRGGGGRDGSRGRGGARKKATRKNRSPRSPQGPMRLYEEHDNVEVRGPMAELGS